MLNYESLKCPRCQSSQYLKNGKVNDQQRYRCKNCGRQFFAFSAYQPAPIIGTSALLLDAENIKLNQKIENFLSNLSSHPLQVKIAFGNWRILGLSRRDLELHERGYQLIHVPEGKDSADGKMIAVGASIFLQYPQIKTVFICSSDWIFSHLCTDLQNRGLTVFWVRRENNLLRVENKETGMVNDYALELDTEIPSLADFIDKFQEIIEAEHESINQRLARLENVATLFQLRCDIKSNNFNNDIKEAEKVTLIQENNPDIAENLTTNESIKQINSSSELETEIIGIYRFLKQRYPAKEITVSTLSSEIQKIWGETLNQIITRLKLAKNGSKFLLDNPKFKLNHSGITYEVTLAEDDCLENSEIVALDPWQKATLIRPNPFNVEANELDNSKVKTINSSDELETAIVEILQAFKKHSPLAKITLTQLSSEFKKVSGETLNEIVIRLKLASSSYHFLLSHPQLKLKYNGITYEVSLEEDDFLEITEIGSPDELEQVLIKLLKQLMNQNQQKNLPLDILAKHFFKKYKKSVAEISKQLNSGKTLRTFIEGCTKIKVEKINNKYHVYLD